ncbi:MAG: hypothetical protein CL917_07155 [Deltaproteobacteria bacterium]|nr:hypothetical protein [Deltaproteobacteria bacterium]
MAIRATAEFLEQVISYGRRRGITTDAEAKVPPGERISRRALQCVILRWGGLLREAFWAGSWFGLLTGKRRVLFAVG